MVQRKVSNNLCIPSDHLKPEKRMGKLRPSSPRFHDGKNKGAEIIKKMKNAKSRKFSAMERCLKSPNFVSQVPQPGKPPPDPKLKQSPNYMRSTNSFESRKEKSQVSSHALNKSPNKVLKNSTIILNLGDKPLKTFTRTSSFKKARILTKAPSFKPTRSANKKCLQVVSCKDLTLERATCSATLKDSKFHALIKSPKKNLKNSTFTLNLDDKPVKSFTRTSNLKKARILTKAPSFKPTKSANKKCSQVVFCEELTSERATCSSTLKDSKFPKYLKLNHGATESEGTSLMKVCPYTYCSLNGHRHAPLPPLKSFLSAKRRIWKTQKDMKLSCLSPRKTETSGDLEVENFGKIAVDVRDAFQKPEVKEDEMDFDIEIYAENKGVNSSIVSGCKGDGVVDGHSNEALKSRNELRNNLYYFNGTNFNTHDITREDDEHPVVDKIGNDCENSFAVTGNRPSCHNRNTFSISYFDEIPVDKKQNVFVQFRDDENKLINDDQYEISTDSVKLREESIFQENQVQYSNEPRQDETHDDCDSNKTNNAKILESGVCDVNVFVGHNLAHTDNSATKLGLEQGTMEIKQHVSNKSLIDILKNLMMRDGESNKVSGTRPYFDEKYKSKNFSQNRNDTDINTGQAQSFRTLVSNNSEDQAHLGLNKVDIADKIILDADIGEMSSSDSSDFKESFLAEKDKAKNQEKTAYTQGAGRSSEDLQNNKINIQIIKCERSVENMELAREFNPREPNYFPIRPDPEVEKVDLRHQDMDDRKNAKEWMIDYALQQTVTRLAPARKRKVELLVEAFEKVIPHQYEPHRMHSYSVVNLARHIQACS